MATHMALIEGVNQGRLKGVAVDGAGHLGPVETELTSVTTSETGTQFVPLPAGACSVVQLRNFSLVDIEYRRGNSGGTATIAAGMGRPINGITNANQIQVRRKDQENEQVTVEVVRFV